METEVGDTCQQSGNHGYDDQPHLKVRVFSDSDTPRPGGPGLKSGSHQYGQGGTAKDRQNQHGNSPKPGRSKGKRDPDPHLMNHNIRRKEQHDRCDRYPKDPVEFSY